MKPTLHDASRVLLATFALVVGACTNEATTSQPSPGSTTRAAEATTTNTVPALTATPFAVGPTAAAGEQATVAEVVDGDTIDVILAGERKSVRLILIDTPEVFGTVECFGPEASAYTRQLLPNGTAVRLERDVSETDRFGRLLRYVWLSDSRMVNEQIVAGGYAQLATFPPDVKYLDRIRAAQAQAREAGGGLWSACVATPAPTVVVPRPTAPLPTQVAPQANCSPAYPDVCIPPPPPDLDCPQIPYRRFRVLPPDPHRLDGDRDGIGCES